MATNPPLDPAILHRSWVRSTEEDTPTELVYRPSSYPFPPSRGREGMELAPDGTMVQSAPGPTDLARQRKGRWRLEDGVLHLALEEPGTGPRVLTIVRATPDRLVVKR
jgi:hypothetical protein